MSLTNCKPSPDATAHECNGVARTDLAALSYSVQLPWPLGTIEAVLETRQGSCDLFNYADRGPLAAKDRENTICCGTGYVSPGRSPQLGIEPEVQSAIVSFLSGCHRRKCRAVDLGANTGIETYAMLSLGATVVSIEPQQDFVNVIRQTAKLHCWENRSIVLHAFACPCSLPWGARGPAQAQIE